MINLTPDAIFSTLVVGLLILIINNAIGRRMMGVTQYSYQPISNLILMEEKLGFNVIFRIFIAPICIVIFSIVLLAINQMDFTHWIWLASLWFAIFQTLLICALGRWSLVSKGRYFACHSASILISFYLYDQLISQGLNHLLPDAANLRSDLWLLIVAFLYGVFRDVPVNHISTVSRRASYIRKKVAFLRKKYSKQLDDLDRLFQDILLAIMVYENFNRPPVTRKIEMILGARTRGIMQAGDATNNEESIVAAINLLKPSYSNLIAISQSSYDFETALVSLFQSYNPDDPSYAQEVLQIFKIIHMPQKISV